MHGMDFKFIWSTTATILIFMNMCQMCYSEVTNVLEYQKMPKLFTLDNYRDCLLRSGGLYCLVDVQLRAPTPNELWYQIKNYSANSGRHYRHDILQKGICVTKKCNITENHSHTIRDDKKVLEELLSDCMSIELQKTYELEGNVTVRYCEHEGNVRTLDSKDWAFISIILGILILNALSTVYHIWCMKTGITKYNEILISFSIILNWKRFMSRSKANKRSFHSIDGLRVMSTVIIIILHTFMTITYSDNTIVKDMKNEIQSGHLFDNISLVVQIFLCMSSFLMAYNFLTRAEVCPINIFTYFKYIFERWIRLTPVYAVIIGYISTIFEDSGRGPLWQDAVGDRANLCRQWWWTNLLYINNYVGDGRLCLEVAWYLGAEFQLFCYGILVLMIVWKFPSIAPFFFGFLMGMVVLIPGVQTYLNNYFPNVPLGPNLSVEFFQENETFQYIYITISGNIGGYTVGIIGGFLQYSLEKKDISLGKNKWLRISFYLSHPLMLIVLMSGSLFYGDGYVNNPLISAIYAALHKLIYAIFTMIFMMGCFHKCDNIIRGFFEWDGFRIVSKLSYCAYLVHFVVFSDYNASMMQPEDLNAHKFDYPDGACHLMSLRE
ncbi:nose resistant to fluoxetine protein 6-like [Arctopsyche grandis]|uniref:nose resistant to fluoxetine protein 6-like n=1 Tax=Arctopsyche grandis TaxID=121162 RepID=UPI00406D7FC5